MAPNFDTTDLATPRMRLRRYRSSDLEAFQSLMSDIEVNRYVAGGALEASEAADLFEKVFEIYAWRRFAVWAVEDLESARYMGHAELKPRAGERGLELIYLLERPAWGHGLGTELARAIRNHAIRDLGVRPVLATIHPENEASRRILVKLDFGFVREWKEPDDDVLTCLWATTGEG